MLKVEHSIDYLKKGKSSSEASEEVQHAKQITLQRKTLRFKRSDDNPELPENFEVGQAVADGNCFFDSFRQGLEQQLGIQVTVKQLRHYCRDFAQNNPPEWFINAIANSYDNSGRVRSETLDSYTIDILNSNRWGDPEVEGRILCEKYQVKLHVVEKLSYLLHLQQQVLNNAREFSDNIRSIIMNSNSYEELALQLQKDHPEEASSLLVDMTAFDGLDNTHQLISSSGPLSLDNINYNDQHTIHIINSGNAHFEPILSTQEVRYNRQQSSNHDTPKEELKIPTKEKPKKKSQDSEQQSTGLSSDRLKRSDNDPNQAGPSHQSSSDDNRIQDESWTSNQEHAAGELKRSLHGNDYQLKLLMLFASKGKNSEVAFRLATEMAEAEKFDDLVFRYTDSQGNIKYRFLQAKHRQFLGEENKIKVSDLKSDSDDNDFSLQKYFVSYLRDIEKKEFRDGVPEDFIICTNTDFDFEPSTTKKEQKKQKTAKKHGKPIFQRKYTMTQF